MQRGLVSAEDHYENNLFIIHINQRNPSLRYSRTSSWSRRLRLSRNFDIERERELRKRQIVSREARILHQRAIYVPCTLTHTCIKAKYLIYPAKELFR